MVVSLFILLVQLLREELCFYFSAIASSPLGFLHADKEHFQTEGLLNISTNIPRFLKKSKNIDHLHLFLFAMDQQVQGHSFIAIVRCSGSALKVFIHILPFAETAQNMYFVMGTSKLS